MRVLFILSLTLYITVHSRSAELTGCHVVQPSVVTVCALWTLCFLPRARRAVGTNRADVSKSTICRWGVVSATYAHIAGITWSSGRIQSWKYYETSPLVQGLNSSMILAAANLSPKQLFLEYRSRILSHSSWFHLKGFQAESIRVHYEISISFGSKVLFDPQREQKLDAPKHYIRGIPVFRGKAWHDRWTDRWQTKWSLCGALFRWCHKKRQLQEINMRRNKI